MNSTRFTMQLHTVDFLAVVLFTKPRSPYKTYLIYALLIICDVFDLEDADPRSFNIHQSDMFPLIYQFA